MRVVAVHFATDRGDCCRGIDGAAQGHWHFPDPLGGQVLIIIVDTYEERRFLLIEIGEME